MHIKSAVNECKQNEILFFSTTSLVKSCEKFLQAGLLENEQKFNRKRFSISDSFRVFIFTEIFFSMS